MQLDSTIFDDYKRITGQDIASYFNAAVAFFSSDYNTIVDYYSGVIQTISSTPFANFTALQQQNKDVFETFKEHSKQFNALKWWLLIEQIEEIDSRLKTLAKINKWARSSLTNVAYDPSIQVDYILQQNQTLENVAGDFMKSNNPNDDWVGIALDNDLREEDYSPEGGVDVKVKFQRVNNGIKINSVVDIMQGKSVYGKDIDAILHFDPVTNDVAVLGYDDTITQAVNILIRLKKKDNPNNPTAGLQGSLVAGTNRALLNFPAIVRQLGQTFGNDDSLKNFAVNNLSIDQDNLACDYVVQTRLDEVKADQQNL